jgi:hypothetical protein
MESQAIKPLRLVPSKLDESREKIPRQVMLGCCSCFGDEETRKSLWIFNNFCWLFNSINLHFSDLISSRFEYKSSDCSSFSNLDERYF